MTGIITEFDLAKTLSLAERLQPEARRLFVVAGSGETDRRWQPEARKVIEHHEPQIRDDISFRTSVFKTCRRIVEGSCDAIVILLTVFADGEGKPFVPAQVAAESVGAVASTGLWTV